MILQNSVSRSNRRGLAQSPAPKLFPHCLARGLSFFFWSRKHNSVCRRNKYAKGIPRIFSLTPTPYQKGAIQDEIYSKLRLHRCFQKVSTTSISPNPTGEYTHTRIGRQQTLQTLQTTKNGWKTHSLLQVFSNETYIVQHFQHLEYRSYSPTSRISLE